MIAHDSQFNRWVAADAAIYFSSEDELSSQIHALSNGDTSIIAMRSAALSRWEGEFQWERILDQYECLITRLLNLD